MVTKNQLNLTTTKPRPTDQAALWGLAVQVESGPDKIGRLLGAYEAISLGEMAGVALLNRTDTKYIMPLGVLIRVLEALPAKYRALEIDGRRLHTYQTSYFDSPDFIAYQHHHNGRRDRYKVRYRQYVDTGLSFLEIKRKNNKDRTVKNRRRAADRADGLGPREQDFISGHYPYQVEVLEPSLWNSFYRITLVSNRRKERLTLDVGLSFGDRHAIAGLPAIAIAEVKQEGFSMDSDFIQQMRRQGIRPTGFSKYCIGLALLHPELKRNRFKDRLLMVNKISQGGQEHVYN